MKPLKHLLNMGLVIIGLLSVTPTLTHAKSKNTSETDPYQACGSLSKRTQQYACFKAYAAWDNPLNRPNIPVACIDKSQAFQPRRYLYTDYTDWNNSEEKQLDAESYSFYYPQEYFSQPIEAKGGRIVYDFNHDKQPDYVFMERKQAIQKNYGRQMISEKKVDGGIRLAICMSSPRGYQRLTQHIPIYVLTDPIYDGSNRIELNRIKLDQDSLLVENAYTQYASDNYDERTWYGWDSRRKAFVLHKAESSNPFAAPSYQSILTQHDLRSKRYHLESHCPSELEATFPQCRVYSDGTLTLKRQPPLLGSEEMIEGFDIVSDSLITIGKEKARTVKGPKKAN